MRPDKNCTLCPLCHGRTKIVLPEGDPSSPLVLVGEAPGAKEDELGRPFVGRSGRLLDKLLEEEGLNRANVLITNTVKCRPPGNRAPTLAEMEACYPFLEEELSRCIVIITLGRSAACNILRRNVKLKDDVNKPRPVTIRGRQVMVIPAYHPAASVYRPEVKDSLRGSFRIAKTYLEGPRNASSTET